MSESGPAITAPWNPLDHEPETTTEDERLSEARRSIENILESYHRNYDVFAELLQNAVDACEQRWNQEGAAYLNPAIWVTLRLGPANEITVCDNGIGMTPRQFAKAVKPNTSFKDYRHQPGARRLRGHKGVGLTFLAYGFNYIRMATRTPDGETCAVMEDGRKWIVGEPQVPLMTPTVESAEAFQSVDRGSCVTVRLDSSTTPKSLGHIAQTAGDWGLLLRSQTALGRLSPDGCFPFDLQAYVTVIRDGAGPDQQPCATEFLFPHLVGTETGSPHPCRYVDLGKYYKNYPDKRFSVPKQYTRQDGMYRFWRGDDLVELLGPADWVGPEGEDPAEFIANTNAWAYGFMAYSTDYYKEHRITTGRRAPLVSHGIVLATEGMTVGDYTEVSLKRYTGRQQQTTCVLHVDGLKPDLGRKTLPESIEELSQLVGRRCIEWFSKDDQNEQFLKPSRKKAPPAVNLEAWADGAKDWAKAHPLQWGSLKLALLSEPQQEQDVVILFSQMIDSRQLPGYQILSAAESNRQYDALMRLVLPLAGQQPYSEENPQGFSQEFLDDTPDPLETPLLVTEFKHELGSLVTDFNSEKKLFRDIHLAIVWSADDFKEGVLGDYSLSTVSTPETVQYRRKPGMTHVMSRQGSDHEIDVILLQDLFELKNDFEAGLKRQRSRYLD